MYSLENEWHMRLGSNPMEKANFISLGKKESKTESPCLSKNKS